MSGPGDTGYGDTGSAATPAMPTAAARPARVLSLDGQTVRDGERDVAVEVAVQVSFADVPFAVMMLTPDDLVDFAYGFSLTEGVIERAADIREARVATVPDGLALHVALVGDRLHKHLARQRAMTGRTGCGVCGIDDIEALRRARGTLADGEPFVLSAIAGALAALDDRQTLNLRTRAVHAAAWADRSGAIIHVREDVGRHNALDKLIGALVRAGVDASSGFVLITSRCSFEMVEKAATFGARLVVAISAPTSFAIDRAQALGVSLCAIARRDTVTLFAGAERVVGAAPPDAA